MEKTRDEIEYDMIKMFDEESKSGSRPVKILLNMYAGHRGKLFISFLFFMIKHSPMWGIPIITANVINFATDPGELPMSFFWWNIGIFAFLLIQNTPMHVLYVRFMSLAIRHVEASLRSTLARKLQSLSMAFHGDMQSGRIQAKVIRDVEAIEVLSKQMMMALLPAVIGSLGAILIAMYYSFIMSLFFLVTIPIAYFVIRGFKTKLQQNNRAFRKEIESMSGQVSEMVEMIPVTRAHGLTQLEVHKVDDTLDLIRAKGYRLDMTEAFFGSANWVAFQTFQAICLVFSIYLAYNGYISIGEVVLFQMLFAVMINGMSSTLNVYPLIAKGFESIHSITEVLLSQDMEEYTGKQRNKELIGELTFQNVQFEYRGTTQHVLEDLSLDIQAGESVALVGESGSGKSTILNLLLGFYRPPQGRILVDGLPMNDMDIQWYRRNLSVVLQSNILFSGSIRDNIAYGMPSVSEEKLQEVIDMANLRSVIDNLPDGLHTRIGEHGGKLSGGQRQRIAIARAFIRDPKIIILDEATSALDNKSEALVQGAMQRLMEGRTAIIVAHRLSTIRHVDRIAVMSEGRCVEFGTYDELMEAKGEFYQLKTMQA